jgi:hypothetical protein
VRLKDAQKHRLASQNLDCHSKKHFGEHPQVLCLVQKQKVFVRTKELTFLVRYFWVLIGVITAWVH